MIIRARQISGTVLSWKIAQNLDLNLHRLKTREFDYSYIIVYIFVYELHTRKLDFNSEAVGFISWRNFVWLYFIELLLRIGTEC